MSLKISLFGCKVARAFPTRASSMLFLSIFGDKIDVPKSPALLASYTLQGHVILIVLIQLACVAGVIGEGEGEGEGAIIQLPRRSHRLASFDYSQGLQQTFPA